MIFDRAVPVLTAVTMSSNNANSAYAKEGDIVTLSFESNVAEPLQEYPTVTIDGNAATVSGSANEWTATYLMQSGDNEGDIDFTVDFVDLAGNVGTQVTSLTTREK